MTVRELIEHLQAVPEYEKDLPVVAATGYKRGDTYSIRDGCYTSYDDTNKRVIKLI